MVFRRHSIKFHIKNDKPDRIFENQQQFVSLNESSSCSVPMGVSSGVPQGSNLVPLLFINDIVTNRSFNARLYADDYVFNTRLVSVEDQIGLNNEFGKVVDCCKSWQMEINYHRTIYKNTLKSSPLCFQYNTNNESHRIFGIQVPWIVDNKWSNLG